MKAVILFNALMVIQVGLYYFDAYLFTPKTSMDAVNANVLYVNLYNEIKEYLRGLDLEVKPLLVFKPVMINERRIDAGIYPLENKVYALNENEVLINEKMAEYIDGNNTITLEIDILGFPYAFEMNIKDVVTEADATQAQIYYNHNAMIQKLGVDYEYYMEENTYYEVITPIDKVEMIYNSYRLNDNIQVNHSILDWRQEITKQMPLYHLFFISLEVTAFALTTFLVFYFHKKDWDLNKTAITILYSLEVPLSKIYAIYLAQKMVIPQVLFLIFFSKLRLYMIFMDVIYFVSLIIFVLSFRKHKIAAVLKQNKD